MQLPRVLKFKKKLKLKNDTANDIPVSDDDYTGRNHDSIDREFKDNNTEMMESIDKSTEMMESINNATEIMELKDNNT